jgi:hypothetical protein
LSADDLHNVEILASLWDTLGYALLQANDVDTGRDYLEASWSLSRNQAARQHLKNRVNEPQRCVTVDKSPGAGAADLYLLFAGNRLVDTQFIQGAESLKQIGSLLAQQHFPAMAPDAGPERIVRRAVAECSETACNVKLLLPAAATK